MEDKTFRIFSETITISLARLANQIVHGEAFQLSACSLVPPPRDALSSNVAGYFEGLVESQVKLQMARNQIMCPYTCGKSSWMVHQQEWKLRKRICMHGREQRVRNHYI